jgi:dihydroxy-acid dehydratase
MTQDSSTYWKRSRVELRAAGFDPDRAERATAVVTIASPWTNAHRCNNRVRALTDLLVDLVAERGGHGLVVGAPAVSDALTQGTPTAGYSLVSRDVVADCFEIGHFAHHGDAMVVISGCDKTGAAALMPLARTNAFGLVLYPGTGSPGCVTFEPWASKGSNLTIMDYAEGRAAQEAGRITAEELRQLEQAVMPGSGTCGAMFTANTMSTIAEAIGMMLPRGASHAADYDARSDIHDDVRAQARASVDALYRLMAAGIRPRDIMTERASRTPSRPPTPWAAPPTCTSTCSPSRGRRRCRSRSSGSRRSASGFPCSPTCSRTARTRWRRCTPWAGCRS